jgi:hypothetical protein
MKKREEIISKHLTKRNNWPTKWGIKTTNPKKAVVLTLKLIIKLLLR